MGKGRERGKAKRKAAPATVGAFTVGQRVKVIAEGSFARGQLGVVDAIDGGTVFVMLAGKQASKGFPAEQLAAV